MQLDVPEANHHPFHRPRAGCLVVAGSLLHSFNGCGYLVVLLLCLAPLCSFPSAAWMGMFLMNRCWGVPFLDVCLEGVTFALRSSASYFQTRGLNELYYWDVQHLGCPFSVVYLRSLSSDGDMGSVFPDPSPCFRHMCASKRLTLMNRPMSGFCSVGQTPSIAISNGALKHTGQRSPGH